MKTPTEFFAFHRNNPRIYGKLVDFAREAKKAGLPKCGIRLLWERTRWFFNIEVERQAHDPFKLNDWYKEYYARLIMHSEPDLAGFFEVRKSIADTMWAESK